jgi:hypothetical protein
MAPRRSSPGQGPAGTPIYECPPLSYDLVQQQLAESGAWALLHDGEEEARGRPGWEVWLNGSRFTVAESQQEAERWLTFKQLQGTAEGFLWRSSEEGAALPGVVPVWQVWVHGTCVGELESHAKAERLLRRRMSKQT